MTERLLEVDGVSKSFGGQLALDDVTLAVGEGAIVGLVGPNGAGKTTLFNVICGLLEPSLGDVRLRGASLDGMSVALRARQGLARTFQRSELFPELTAREHLVLAHRMRRGRRRSRGRDPVEATLVERLVHGLELEDVADRPVADLPLGARRLVEVGRALAVEPAVVLLDEPSSGLDQHETERVAGVIRQVRIENRVAFVLVEHDVDFVLGMSDEVYVLDDGRVIARGSPTEIRRDPAVRAAYLGPEEEPS